VKTPQPSLAVVTAAALLAWPVLTAVPAQAEDSKKPKNEEAAAKPADPEKKKKREEARAKKIEAGKKPEPAKKPAEPAKKPEPAKPAPPAAGSSVVATVVYDKGSGANLKGRDDALGKVRAALKHNPGAKFTITGHADDTPYPVANQEISENRAKFLAAYLRTNGIPKNRVESRGVGNTQAVKGQPNRRAVIEMKK
jgi:outer membrane protein OmpA-like peptidoglycan-associated protein